MRAADVLMARLTTWRARRSLRACEEVGDGVIVEGSPTIRCNSGRMRVGRRFHFSSVPAPSHMVSGPTGSLEIGDDVSIGHGAAVAAYGRVTIGSGTQIGPFVIIMDTDFHVAGDRSGEPETEPITIGAQVRIGSHVTVLRGSQIGDGAVVAAGAVVAGHIRKGARVTGVPAREAFRQESPGALTKLSVPEVVRQSLGLSQIPSLKHGPSEIPQWDSLGALRLLLALEEAFGVTLSEDEVLKVSNVADLARVVERAATPSGAGEDGLEGTPAGDRMAG